MLEAKTTELSFVTSSKLVMPDETNPLGNLMGGNLMKMMDEIGALCAMRHSERYVVTASVDNVSFAKPIKMGSMVTVEACVTRAFNSSMEIYLVVKVKSKPNKKEFVSNEAFYTFVAVDQAGTPIAVPKLTPSNELEEKRFQEAQRRRELRLMMAGKIKSDQASELRSLFQEVVATEQ